MQTHETPSFQPAASSLKNNLPAPRPSEDIHAGQELDSLSTNPFPPRPHEVWMGEPRGGSTNPFPRRPHEVYMGEPKIARKPISPLVQAEATLDPEASPFIFGNRPFRMNPPDAPPPPPRRWGIQAKVAIGQPNDVYEQEADRVAEQVMGMSSAAAPTVQREEEESEEIQTKPLAETITPLVQRQEDLEEDEPIQAKCEDCEAEEPIQRFANGTAQAQPDLENRLNASQGRGTALPDEVRSFMEPRFGADFSQVRVHTGSEAVQMNRDLNAQAFTHKQDVYYGAENSPANDALTAHELTHVVQQTNGGITTNKKSDLRTYVQRSDTGDRADELAKWKKRDLNGDDIISKLNPATRGKLCEVNCPAAAGAVAEYLKTRRKNTELPELQCDPMSEKSFQWNINGTKFSGPHNWRKAFQKIKQKTPKHGSFAVIETLYADNIYHYFVVVKIQHKQNSSKEEGEIENGLYVIDAYGEGQVTSDVSSYGEHFGENAKFKIVEGQFHVKRIRVQ